MPPNFTISTHVRSWTVVKNLVFELMIVYYRGDLNTRRVWYSNGCPLSNIQMLLFQMSF